MAETWGGPLWRAADLYTPMALRVAATLRVADAIAAGVTTGPALAARLGVAEDPLVRVLDHLVTAGFLSGDDGSYALTDDGQWLRDDHPERVRSQIDLTGAIGRADLSAVELLHTVRTGEAAFPQRFGHGFWEDLAAHPEVAESFDRTMGSQEVAEVAAAYDWAALGDVIDVGGGDGTLLIGLLTAHPSLRGTVIDLPAPATTAEKALRAAGLADRGRALTGSFFDPLPGGAGGYVLSRVLHDWSDADAARILANCARGGPVIVIEEANGGVINTEMNLRMLAYCLGRERTVDQLVHLARGAGLAPGRVVSTGYRDVIELLPAPAPS
ncbi:methyltransferase [Herbidospora sp. RD11066]